MKRLCAAFLLSLSLLGGTALVADQAVVSRYSGGIISTITTFLQGMKTNRITGSGTAPTCSSTGLGTGSGAIAAGSTDVAGLCTLSPAGAPAATGVMTLTFTSAYGGNGGPVCVALLVDGTGPWRPTGYAVSQTALSTTAPTFEWENAGTALAAGSTYHIAYHCIAR